MSSSRTNSELDFMNDRANDLRARLNEIGPNHADTPLLQDTLADLETSIAALATTSSALAESAAVIHAANTPAPLLGKPPEGKGKKKRGTVTFTQPLKPHTPGFATPPERESVPLGGGDDSQGGFAGWAGSSKRPSQSSPVNPKAKFWTLQYPTAAAEAGLKAYKSIESLAMTAPRAIMEHAGRPASQTFIGAVLCDCIKIDKFLLEGGYGRGFKATWTDASSGFSKAVFVKTFGTDSTAAQYPYENEPGYLRFDKEIRLEAEVYAHPWLPAAIDHPGCVTSRLCYGSVKYPDRQGLLEESIGNIFFVCGELCEGDDLWAYMCHSRAFPEPAAKRLFGQLALGMNTMKHCGDSTVTEGGISGCFHRDLKLENLMVNGEYDCKIIDVGTLKFTAHPDVISVRGTADAFKTPGGGFGFLATTPIPMITAGTDIYRPPEIGQSPHLLTERSTDLYDPAAWDVWSAGVILFFLVAAEQVSKALGSLRGEVFSFFHFALQSAPLTDPDPDKVPLWDRCNRRIGGNLFFPTDRWGRPNPATTINNIPMVQRDENGYPVYPRLWRTLEKYGGKYSEDLKNLLSRMLDVDPKKRIRIEEVCKHPWLQSHQAPWKYMLGPQPDLASLETPEQKAEFLTHMQKRTKDYIENRTPGKEVIPTDEDLTLETALERIRPCLEVNLLPYTAVACSPDKGKWPLNVLIRILIQPRRSPDPRTLFTVDIYKNRWEVTWESHHLGCASLSDWHAFSQALVECVKGRMPAPNPQKMRAIVHDGIACDISLANPIVGKRYHKIGLEFNLCEAAFDNLPDDEKLFYEVITHEGATPVPWATMKDDPSYVSPPGVRDVIEQLNLINAQRQVLDRAANQLMSDLHFLLEPPPDSQEIDFRAEAELFVHENTLHEAQANDSAKGYSTIEEE